MTDRRIVILSDIHANAPAFRAGVSLARSLGFDEMIVLGDLLTYGCEVQETLDLAKEVAHRDRARFVLGNHDQIYLDCATGDTRNIERLPAWLKESISWTFERLSSVDLQSLVPWSREIRFAGTIFAHANPFEYGNWTYLRDLASFNQATDSLHAKASTIGIFGHTHRYRVFSPDSAPSSGVIFPTELNWPVHDSMTVAMTVPALGQPREVWPGSSILVVEPSKTGVSMRVKPVEYDLDAHVRAISNSGMSENTINNLKSYFR